MSRWEGMKTVVSALVRTIPGIGNVLLVVIVFWLVFSIVGVQFFAGKFARCIDVESGDRISDKLVPSRSVCEANNETRRWMNPTINFDNVFSGYLSLLQVATFESWTDILEAAVDIPDNVGEQPSRERSFSYAIYFIIFIIFGSFFLLNLFIGVIVDSFSELKKEMEISAVEVFLTENQRNYYKTIKALGTRPQRRQIPRPVLFPFLYDLASSTIFEAVMAGVIVLSCIVLATTHFNQSQKLTEIQEWFNISFTIIFTIEALIRIGGFRIHYFRDAWNIFDFTLVIWSIVVLQIDDQSNEGDPTMTSLQTSSLLRALRVLRIGKLVRLIRWLTSVRTLIFSLISSLPALFNVGCLLSLMISMYAIVGMILFGHIRHQGVINDVVNFETFGNSFLLLFRLTTLAGWDGVLAAMSVQPEHIERGSCDPDFYIHPLTNEKVASNGGNCGSPILAAVFLSTFIIISNFVLTNIFVAIILENVESATETTKTSIALDNQDEITDEDVDNFFIIWLKFDPGCTQFINFEQLPDLLHALPPPFRFPKPNKSFIALLDLPIISDQEKKTEKINCGDCLLALVHHRSVGKWYRLSATSNLNHWNPNFDLLIKATEMEKIVLGNWKSTIAKNSAFRTSTTLKRRLEITSAIIIQRAWRNRLAF